MDYDIKDFIRVTNSHYGLNPIQYTLKEGVIMYYIVFLENEETGKLYTKKVKEFDMVQKFMKKPNYIAFLPASVWEGRGLDK